MTELQELDFEDDEENTLSMYSYISNHICFEYFVGYQITTLLGYKNPSKTITANVSKSNQLIFSDYPGVKEPEINPKTILISRDGAIEILLKTRKRISPDVLHLLKEFHIETTNMKCLTKEQQTLSAITNAFKTEKFEDQYKIGSYYLDLYFTEYKIVVECDENGHADRKPYKERERMDYVNKELDIDDSNWIRYNPDEKDFDISKMIGRIYTKMKEIKFINESKIVVIKNIPINDVNLIPKLYRFLPIHLNRCDYVIKNKNASTGQRWCNGWCQVYKLVTDFTKRSDYALTICLKCENMIDIVESKIKDGTMTEEQVRKNPSIILLGSDGVLCRKCNIIKHKDKFQDKKRQCEQCRLSVIHKHKEDFDTIVEKEVEILRSLGKDDRDKKLNMYIRDQLYKIATFCSVGRKYNDTKPTMYNKLVLYFDTYK